MLEWLSLPGEPVGDRAATILCIFVNSSDDTDSQGEHVSPAKGSMRIVLFHKHLQTWLQLGFRGFRVVQLPEGVRLQGGSPQPSNLHNHKLQCLISQTPLPLMMAISFSDQRWLCAHTDLQRSRRRNFGVPEVSTETDRSLPPSC